MKRPSLTFIGLALMAAVAASFAWHHPAKDNKAHPSRTLERHRQQAEPRPKATLYCDFYNFTHNATVVSFYFSVDQSSSSHPDFTELFVVEPDGTKTEFEPVGATPPPRWIFDKQDETPIITSPDRMTTIVLYGLEQSTIGTFWVEAGVRSNIYKNLEGKCRQANFG